MVANAPAESCDRLDHHFADYRPEVIRVDEVLRCVRGGRIAGERNRYREGRLRCGRRGRQDPGCHLLECELVNGLTWTEGAHQRQARGYVDTGPRRALSSMRCHSGLELALEFRYPLLHVGIGGAHR